MLTRSTLLAEARHGFSTRMGGVSEGRYASLNLGAKWGDDPARVQENRRRLAGAGGFTLERLFTAVQVHGAEVVGISAESTPEETALQRADALVTATPGVALGIVTADCVPILFSDGKGRVGAAHAGWRGTLAGVGAATVRALVSLGARPETLRAALGPSICAACFEVGEEVASEFARRLPAHPEVVIRAAGAKPHVDLSLANRLLLEEAGVRAVDGAPPCTMCDPAAYYSFRRDGANIGQHLSFIVAL